MFPLAVCEIIGAVVGAVVADALLDDKDK